MAELFKHEFQRESDMDEDGTQPVMPIFTRSTKKREQSTLQKWVQCTRCKKWRRVPFQLKDGDLGENWECKDNAWDSQFSSCKIPQALSDEQIDAILDACQESEEDLDDDGNDDRVHHTDGLPISFQASLPEALEDMGSMLPKDVGDLGNAFPRTITRRIPIGGGLSTNNIRTSSRIKDRITNILAPESTSSALKHSQVGGTRVKDMARALTVRGRASLSRSARDKKTGKLTKNVRNGAQDINEVVEALLGTNGNYLYSSMGDPDFHLSSMGGESEHSKGCRFSPGKIVWGKVDGHDWWPALVVRRRSVPSEVGPPPGGVSEVMTYTPVVFFTPKGIPKEVELGMDSVEFPIAMCRRACGEVDEDEAEYAWLSQDKIRPFLRGQNTGRYDGNAGTDLVLRDSVAAAHRALVKSNHPSPTWSTDEEDSDGGWACAAGLVGGNGGKTRSHKKKHNKSKGHNKKKTKGDEDGSDGESGDGGQEWLSYGSWLPQPKIVVEHIHAWRHPQMQQEREKEREIERRNTHRRLRQLAALQRAIDHGLHPAECLACVVNVSDDVGDMDELPSRLSTRQLSDEIMPENFPGENLRQEEREAVSTLLGFSENPVQFSTAPFSSTAQDPHGCGEPEYFVKYANRSHMYNEWVNESTLYKIAKRKLVNFKRRYGDGPVNMFLEEWAEPERLVARRKCRVGPGWELLVKWKELGYEHCTWEVENCRMLAKPEAVTLYLALWDRQRKSFQRSSPSAKKLAQEIIQMAVDGITPGQPCWVRGSRLLPHQIDSLNWFRRKWLDSKPGVLIGNAGLGKTACAISFIQSLREELMTTGPILVVVPNGQLDRWSGEVAFWSGGQIDCVIYQGPSAARSIIWDYEIWQAAECVDGNIPCHETRKIPRAEVVLTSYENMTADFSQVPWSLIVLDCRGGSKGSIARMVTLLSGIEAMHLLLASQLPDTPGGLTSMLKFINAQTENDMDDSMSNDSGSEEENLVVNLQQLLSQHMFKVTRPQEEGSFSRFREFMVPFKFTLEQEDSFRRTLAKHYEVLTDQSIPRHSSQNVSSFRRIVQDLCQVCHHPLLLEDDPEDLENSTCASLLKASGKLQILNHILDCVQIKGCRAMVLTQTTKMSDLLSQYLILRFGQNSYERAIPSDSTLVQHQSIQKFSKSSSPFVFLATPDTCGLGMCLPSVNLVVVYDSSPDPSNELLATGRARKIGNSSELPIIRLFAENSVEEKVLHLAERRENGLEALLGAVHTRGTAADSKLLEDILVCGSQLVFSKKHLPVTLENRDNMNLDSKGEPLCSKFPGESLSRGPQEMTPQKLGSDDVMHIVNKVLTINDGLENPHEKCGKFEAGGAVVRWCIRGINLETGIIEPGIIGQKTGDELFYDAPSDGGSCSTYWENLVKQTWDGLKREEKIRQEKIRPVLEVSDNEDESGDLLDLEGAPQGADETLRKSRNNSIKASSRRKRSQEINDMEVDETVGSRKRRKSARPMADTPPHHHRDFFYRRNEYDHWSRDSLLNSKAQQDVLMRVISDPSTLEGQAAKRAFARIDQIAEDLRLPTNVVLMARQIAEVLLTMREESDQGAYFQDYTLVVLVAFAAHLGNLDLGEKYGLTALSQKYGQDLAAMEQVFVHVTRMMQEYKETMLKIKGLDGNTKGAISTGENRKELCAPSSVAVPKQEPTVIASTKAFGKEKEGAFLHKELDHFLNRWSEVLEADHRPQVDVPHSALSEPPGAPIKGQTPSYQWYLANSTPNSPELVDLFRQARACDMEIYVIEKAHALKYKAIEKVVLDFQEKVREYGLKALEEVKGQALRMSQQVVARQASIQTNLANLSVQQPQVANGISGPQSTYQYIMRALQGGTAPASIASLPLASSSLTPSLHSAPVVHTKQMEHVINLSPTCTPVSSIAARPPSAPHPPPPTTTPQVPVSQGQPSLESLSLVQKNISGGTTHPAIQPTIGPHMAVSQQWRGFVPPGTTPAPNSPNVKAIERLLLAHLNPCQAPQGDRSQPNRMFPRVQNVQNQQVLLQQLQHPPNAHVQRLMQEQSLNPMVKPTSMNYSPRQPCPSLAPHSASVNLALPPVSLHQPAVNAIRPGTVPTQPLGSSVQIPASFGAALSSLIPQYTSFRVVSQSGTAPASSTSGATPQAEPATGSLTPRNGPQLHAHNTQTSMSIVHGTARVIHEKPPAIHLEPAQAARVVLSHPGIARPASSVPCEAVQPIITESVLRTSPPEIPVQTSATISTGDMPAVSQSPGTQPPGAVGTTITTGSGLLGSSSVDTRENGNPGHQSILDINAPTASKQGSVVTTGTDPGMDLAPSGSVTSFPKTLGPAGFQSGNPPPVQVPPLPASANDPSRADARPAAAQSTFQTPLRMDKLSLGDMQTGASQQGNIDGGSKLNVPIVPSVVRDQNEKQSVLNDSIKRVVSGFEMQVEAPPKGAEQNAQANQIEDILTGIGGKWKE